MPKYDDGPLWEQHAGRCATMRSRVHQLVDGDHFDDAIALSKEIPIAWYRVQSVAKIAENIPDAAKADALLKQGLDIAMTGENEYKRTAVCAWLIAAAARRNLDDRARTLLSDVHPLTKQIEPPLSRADALALLWQAAVPPRPPRLRAAHPRSRRSRVLASALAIPTPQEPRPRPHRPSCAQALANQPPPRRPGPRRRHRSRPRRTHPQPGRERRGLSHVLRKALGGPSATSR